MKNYSYSSLLIFLLFYATHTTAQTQKPNIIIVLADDVGYKNLKVDGGNLYNTPYIDTLAQNGMRFTQCYSSPLCSPSRFMLITGKYNFRNYTKWGAMDKSEKTIGNMMKDAGYKTGFFGKDQFGGGGDNLTAWGFDVYCVHSPFTGDPEMYKNPLLYTHGAYLPDSLTSNKYGPDIVSDSLLQFIEDNASNPFFVYYPLSLVHEPWCPTPDDTVAFANWQTTNPPQTDTSFYPSMMHYMDKEIGKLINKIKSLGIENNTVIIFSGDNGTNKLVTDYVNEDTAVSGGKSTSTNAGTHVPLIVVWPTTVTPGSLNNDIIDFTDFLPTSAGIANISLPTDYGTLDGVSFAPRLVNQPGSPRSSIFDYFDHHPGQSKPKRWAQTAVYKLYDTSSTSHKRLFYNLSIDELEKHPLADTALTPDETLIKQQLLTSMNGYTAQGIPLLTLQPAYTFVNDSTITFNDTIRINGGSTISACGAVWSTSPNPDITSSQHTSVNAYWGGFLTTVTGLAHNTTYYIRAYATNFAGTAYSNQLIITTAALPVANPATAIDSVKFTANWSAYQGATGYRLDISTSPTFSKNSAATLTENFNNGITPPDGWSFTNNIVANNSSFGAASPSIEFTASNARVVTTQLPGPAKQLKFWLKGLNTNSQSAFLVEGFDGTNWIKIIRLTNITTTGATRILNATSNPALAQNFIQFRFTYTKNSGTLAFDDVSINYNNPLPLFVTGYNNLLVQKTSRLISSLKPATNYYYRIRAVKGTSVSGNSNVINATTCSKPSIINIITNNLLCSDGSTGSVSVNITGGVPPLMYSWTGDNNFTSALQNISNLRAGNYHLAITSNGGCRVDTNIVLTAPPALSAGVNAGDIACFGGTTTLTVNASGGTGNYHYSLFDGTNTMEPQNENYFTVGAGNYAVIITDDNGCSSTTNTLNITQPQSIAVTLQADSIQCPGAYTTLTVNATGGTGNYRYTLFDGTNTTGPQTDNYFTVKAGSYSLTVADDNNCAYNTSITIGDGTGACNRLKAILYKPANSTNNLVAKKEFKASIFPNPSAGPFSLRINTGSGEKVEVIITDAFGRKVLNTEYYGEQTLSMGKDLVPGIYFVRIMQGKNIKTLKLIKQKN